MECVNYYLNAAARTFSNLDLNDPPPGLIVAFNPLTLEL